MADFTPADMAAVVGRNNGEMGDFGSWWVILVIILMWNRGGWGGYDNGNPVTEGDLCSANSFNELKSQVGRMSDMQNQQFMQTWNGMSNMGYETQNLVNRLQQQISECCCNTQRAIDGVNYNIAEQACAVKNAIHQEAETTRRELGQMITQDKFERMQARINELENNEMRCFVNNAVNQATAGMIRLPQQFTYPWPFPWPMPSTDSTTTTS